MIRRRRREATTDVVAALQERVRQAQALASVPEQQLLSNPRLNPATRATADALEAERLRAALEAEHRRVLRAQRETERRAEEAVRAAAAVDAARAATDPALTVLSVVRSRRWFTAICLAASLVLSIGSAMGLEAAVQRYHPAAPTGIGYLAEIALTGMSTAAIVWSGLLARTGARFSGPVRAALGALVALPLAVSAVGATLGSGPVGAVTSLGSAAFAALAWLVATTAATATAALLNQIDQRPAPVVDEADENDEPSPAAGDALAVVGDALAEQAAAYLRALPERPDHTCDRVDESTSDRAGEPSSGRTDESTSDRAGDHTGNLLVATSDCPPGHTVDEAADSGDERAARARAIAARRREEGRRNRRMVADYIAAHPDATTREIADATGLSETTIRRIRRDLRGEG